MTPPRKRATRATFDHIVADLYRAQAHYAAMDERGKRRTRRYRAAVREMIKVAMAAIDANDQDEEPYRRSILRELGR